MVLLPHVDLKVALIQSDRSGGWVAVRPQLRAGQRAETKSRERVGHELAVVPLVGTAEQGMLRQA